MEYTSKYKGAEIDAAIGKVSTLETTVSGQGTTITEQGTKLAEQEAKLTELSEEVGDMAGANFVVALTAYGWKELGGVIPAGAKIFNNSPYPIKMYDVIYGTNYIEIPKYRTRTAAYDITATRGSGTAGTFHIMVAPHEAEIADTDFIRIRHNFAANTAYDLAMTIPKGTIIAGLDGVVDVTFNRGTAQEMAMASFADFPFTLPYDAVTVAFSTGGNDAAIYINHDNDIKRRREVVTPNGVVVKGDIAAGGELTISKNSVVTGKSIAFTGTISAFSKLLVGHGKDNYDGSWLEIDASEVVVCNNETTSISRTSYSHGLTIANNIQVLIDKQPTGTNIRISSNGETYEQKTTGFIGNGVIFAMSEGSTLTECSLGFMATKLGADTWCFGDSYFSIYSERWTYYLLNGGHTNVLLNAYGGENSDNAYYDLTNLLKMAKPKRIVWCLGMNDQSVSSTNPGWEETLVKVKNLCHCYGIELVLATIPNVPTRDNSSKNEAVKASGYRYIDFASAVGGVSAGSSWYEGMLSSDGVHPTAKGAIALYHQAIADCPELMAL